MNIITVVYISIFLRNFENIRPEFHLSMEKYGLKMFVQNLIKVEKYGQKCQKF